jgi:heptosyltransferase-2
MSADRPSSFEVPAPLLVRLPNWVGDVCMALPALCALEARGLSLHLAGRAWAVDLLGGHPWPVLRLPQGLRAAAAALRPVGASRGLLFTNSLSSAAAFRMAGVAALGYRNEGRSPLLGRAVARTAGHHEVDVFWRLARETVEWLGLPALPPAPPARLGLRIAIAHAEAADAALRAVGLSVRADPDAPARAGADAGGPVDDRFLVLAPLAAGTTGGRSKAWPGFAALSRELAAAGLRTVCCPGPGEEAAARAAAPEAIQLPGLGLGAYAALCARAGLTVANDSGPMHLAAAAGAPVLGVFGPGDPARTRPWGPGARWIGGNGDWPTVEAVASEVMRTWTDPAGWVAPSPLLAPTPFE